MDIDDLLSPYRGFKPEFDEVSRTLAIARSQAVWRATTGSRGPALESPDTWESYDFIEDLPA